MLSVKFTLGRTLLHSSREQAKCCFFKTTARKYLAKTGVFARILLPGSNSLISEPLCCDHFLPSQHKLRTAGWASRAHRNHSHLERLLWAMTQTCSQGCGRPTDKQTPGKSGREHRIGFKELLDRQVHAGEGNQFQGAFNLLDWERFDGEQLRLCFSFWKKV